MPESSPELNLHNGSTGVASAPELTLAGKVFLLTGASRGIGAATAIELARRGAVVIGPLEHLGGRMVAPVADLTRAEHRTYLLQQIRRDFGQIDGIIFNHTGGMEKDLLAADPDYHLKVNGYSKLYLFQEAELARVLQDRFVVIDVPSLWSTFQHTDIEQLPQYSPVAEGKKLGERLLRKATREYNEFNQARWKEVKFGSVCGHAIGDTTTVKLLSRMNREAMAAVEQTAEGGKLPTITDMAQAIANMAEGKFENEDIVFVGPPQIRKDEMAQSLPMYDDQTRYVDSLVRFDDRRSFGYYRVRGEDTVYHFSDTDGELNLDRGGNRATLDVTNNHTLGHFTPEFGISVLPGHKMVAACAEVASFNLINERPYMVSTRLAGVDGSIEFKVPVLPGDRISIEVQNSNTSVKIGNTEAASITGLRFEEKNREYPVSMTPDRLIEAAAQTLGLAFLHSRDIREVLPLFGGVKGPVEYPREVYPGQLLEMEAVLDKGEGIKQFSGDVIIRVDDEVVASIRGIDCRLFPSRGLDRVIRMGRSRLE